MRARFSGRPEAWFDPTAFVLQPAGTLGTSGRGAFIGPNLRTVDLSAMKNFRIAERANIQFRAEAFNILNRANFGVPNLIAFTGTRTTKRRSPRSGASVRRLHHRGRYNSVCVYPFRR